jgi:sugar phosphate isomerase/epimerase
MNINRREFLQTGAAATAGSLSGIPLISSCLKGKNSLKDIGLITYTIREEINNDFVKTLEEVAGIGYKYLELGSYLGDSLAAFRELLERLGLIPLAGGGDMSIMIEQESLKEMIDEALELGKKYLVCYWPWLGDADHLGMEDVKQAADNLNRLGHTCREAGIRFAFHNHDKAFLPVGEVIPFDYLMDNTDPELVLAEIDLYWIHKGNAEPIPYFEKYSGRFELVHVKDMDDTPDRSFACVGDGIIDFPRIFSYAQLAGMKYLIVEHDSPQHPMQCIRDSFNYLQEIL